MDQSLHNTFINNRRKAPPIGSARHWLSWDPSTGFPKASSSKCPASSPEPQSGHDLPSRQDSFDEVITLIVGKGSKPKKIIVHANVAVESSAWFKTTCKPEWMDPTKAKVIHLPEDALEAVQGMVGWIYSGKIAVPERFWKHRAETEASDGMITPWGYLARLYIIADKFDFPHLHNAVIDACVIYHKSYAFNVGIVSYVYKDTEDTSKLRKLMVQMARHGSTAAHVLEIKLPKDFVNDILTQKDRERVMTTQSAGTCHIILEDPEDIFCAKYHIDAGPRGLHKPGVRCKSLESFAHL